MKKLLWVMAGLVVVMLVWNDNAPEPVLAFKARVDAFVIDPAIDLIHRQFARLPLE